MKTRRAKTIQKMKNKMDQFADLKIYYKTTINKTVWY